MAKGTSFRKFIIVDDNTIRETRDRQEEKRPRKRARVVDSDDEEQLPNSKKKNPNDTSTSTTTTTTTTTKPAERDSRYYLDDDPTATCIFRVENVLFKVRFSFSYKGNRSNNSFVFRSTRKYSNVLNS